IRVRDVMTPEVIYCFEDALVGDAALLMQKKQVRRLLVLNRDERLVGIVSLGDLAVETGDEQLAGNTLEAVSESNRPDRESLEAMDLVDDIPPIRGRRGRPRRKPKALYGDRQYGTPRNREGPK